MIRTLLVSPELTTQQLVKERMEKYHPEIDIREIRTETCEIDTILNNPGFDLLIMELPVEKTKCLRFVSNSFFEADIETIFIASTPKHALEAIQCRASGYVLKPIVDGDLITAINNAKKRIEEKWGSLRRSLVFKHLQHQIPPYNLIGIPTLQGFEFIQINDIIRCEGLQKCTKIIIREKPNLISSYSIGEFKKTLETFHFFSPHKSHLINLSYIVRYSRKGLLYLTDNSCVPVSRRKRNEFLEILPHL